MPGTQPRMVLKHRPWRTTEVVPGPNPVFVKHFHDARFPGRRVGRWRDRRRAQREARRLADLERAGVPVPAVIGIHETEASVELRLAFLVETASLEDVLAVPPPSALAHTLGRLLASLHAAGFAHGDLHLGNVLVGRDGRAWLVDAAAIRRGSSSARAHDLVQAAAATRERTSARFRARFFLAYLRAYLRATSASAHTTAAPRRTEASSLVEAIEGAARIARRERVHSEIDRWLRPSGVCARHVDGDVQVLAPLACPRDEAVRLARRALDSANAAAVAIRGHAARRAWTDAAQLAEQRIPAARPLVFVENPVQIAVLDSPAVSRDPEVAVQDDARAVGTLAGALWDRGLAVALGDIRIDAVGTAFVVAGARIEPARSVQHALRSWRGERAAHDTDAADWTRNAGFVPAFLAAQCGTRIQRDHLRALLVPNPRSGSRIS